MGRERWSSKTIFLFAAIGSAVGLGNVWRFPYVTYKFGGGAFLLAYLVVLLAMGIPLMMLEFGIGQRLQKGPIEAFAHIHKKFAGLGLLAILVSGIIISYYAVVIAWALIYFIKSLTLTLPWINDAEGFFFDNVLQATPNISTIGGFNWPIFAALAAVWIAIYFCVWKGVKSLGKAVKYMLPIPIILLVLLLIRAMTLPNFLEGWIFYLQPHWPSLLNPELWITAIGQAFFSLSLGSGIMIAYASFNKRSTDVTAESYITAFADSAIAILSGFVVFGILGYMAGVEGVGIADVVASGPGLAFIAFPKALSMMPFAWFFSAMFFLVLLNFGITSAFSLVETVNTIFTDSKTLSNAKSSLLICGTLFLSGIIFTTGAGVYFLDVVDHHITKYGLIIVGILESLVIGWFFDAARLRHYINAVSKLKVNKLFDYSLKFIIPICLTVLLLFNLVLDLKTNYEGYPDWAINIGWAVVVVPLIAAAIFSWIVARNGERHPSIKRLEERSKDAPKLPKTVVKHIVVKRVDSAKKPVKKKATKKSKKTPSRKKITKKKSRKKR